MSDPFTVIVSSMLLMKFSCYWHHQLEVQHGVLELGERGSIARQFGPFDVERLGQSDALLDEIASAVSNRRALESLFLRLLASTSSKSYTS
jgi:hypothetical protein